ncbi:MAG: hypothetical protein JXA97_04470 [Anaerolineales bacterium]|nr:hypothetical protein [Anaerolineales bacterium]
MANPSVTGRDVVDAHIIALNSTAEQGFFRRGWMDASVGWTLFLNGTRTGSLPGSRAGVIRSACRDV